MEQFLAPTLQPGDVVVLDNLNSHKVAGVRGAIEARGATVATLRLLAGPQPIIRQEADDPTFEEAAVRRPPRRADLLQDQSRLAQGRSPKPRDLVERYRPHSRHHHTQRMPKLPRPCRLRFHMNGKRSSSGSRSYWHQVRWAIEEYVWRFAGRGPADEAGAAA